MAEGLGTRFGERTPDRRQIGRTSSRMYREADRALRKGYGEAAGRIAVAAAEQSLREPGGIRSATEEIAAMPFQRQAATQAAALAAGMRPGDSRQKLFADMQAAASGGLSGEAGARTLAGFRSRASQLGVSGEAFDRTASGRLGIDLASFRSTPPSTTDTTGTTGTAPTPPATTGTAPTPPTKPAASEPVGRIGGKPASEVLIGMRNDIGRPSGPALSGTSSRGAATGASGDIGDFLRGVRALTSPEGGDMLRGAAVDELNRQRASAGFSALDREEVLNRLLQQDREAAADRTRTNAITRGLSRTPDLTVDPTLARAATPTQPPAPAPAPAPTPAAAPAAAPAQPSPSRPSLTSLRAEPVRGDLDVALRERAQRPSAFEGSRGQAALQAAAQAIQERTGGAAAREAQLAPAVEAARRVKRKVFQATRGTGFEGSPLDNLLRRAR